MSKKKRRDARVSRMKEVVNLAGVFFLLVLFLVLLVLFRSIGD